MSANVQESGVLPAITNRQVISAVGASCMGWALDLFDLFVLLYVAPVIGRLFFPFHHSMLSLAAVYASFAVTLLMRPLGSALFGSYADRHGRKGAMTVAVVGVGVATALFGALPTVAQVGLVAPALFLLLRLVQGVFVGGVVASTHTIGTESVAPKYRGAVSGLVGGGGAGLGALLASLAYLVMSSLFPGPAFDVWGWRCMFFTGILSSFLGFFVFSSLEESPLWQKLKAEKDARAVLDAGARQDSTEPLPVVRSPLGTLWSPQYRPTLLVNLLLTIGGGRRLLPHFGLFADLSQARQPCAQRRSRHHPDSLQPGCVVRVGRDRPPEHADRPQADLHHFRGDPAGGVSGAYFADAEDP